MKTLSNSKIIALCMGDFSRGLINGIITTYLLTFFIPTNANTTLPQFFLNAALVMAVIRGIGTVIDAITDPWVANLTDNCKHRLGRRIPFMRWSAVPYGMCCLMIFFPPVNGTSMVNAIWVGILLVLYYLFSTLYNIPFSALQAEIVADPKRRVFLYTMNSLLYVISNALVFCSSMFKGMLMGAGFPEIWALRIPFIVCCVGGTIAALIPAFVIREQDYIAPKTYSQPLAEALKAIFSYKNFTIITIGYLVMWGSIHLLQYRTGLLHHQSAGTAGCMGHHRHRHFHWCGCMYLSPGKHSGTEGGQEAPASWPCVTYVCLYCAIYNYQVVIGLIGAKAFALVIGFVIAMPIAITNIIPASMFADLAQYDTIKTGQNRAGMFLAARNFANKLCQSIVVISCSLLLGRGADGTGAATSEGVQSTALVACVFVACALGIYFFYNDKEITAAIQAHNKTSE